MSIDTPAVFVDGNGFFWEVEGDGRIGMTNADNSFNDPFSSGFDWLDFSFFSQGISQLGGRGILLGTDSNVGSFGVSGTREIFVSPDSNFVRYLDTVTNTTAQAITYTYRIDSQLNSGFNTTTILSTSNGDQFFGINDFSIVTDDGDGSAGGDPVVGHLFGDGSLSTSSAILNGDDVEFQYTITLEAGESASFLQFGIQGNTQNEVEDTLNLISDLDPGVLIGLDQEDLDQIVNFETDGLSLIQSNFMGDEQSNIFQGTILDETFVTLGGNDVVLGNEGDDVINAGAGDDTVLGGVGNDTILGEAGNDTIDGGDGNDVISGDSESIQSASQVVTVPSTQQELAVTLTVPEGSDTPSLEISGFINRAPAEDNNFNIVYVVDSSGSTADTFLGTETVGDLNFDGASNQLIDGIILGFQALNDSILQAGLPLADVRIISFDSEAVTLFDGVAGSGVNPVLTTLDSGGGTNFEAALQETISALQDFGPGSNRVFFLSDGENGSGVNFADEVATLTDPLGLNAEIRAIGLGNDADLTQLDIVDDGIENNSAERVLTPSELSAGLTGSPVDQSEISQLIVSVNGNTQITLQPDEFTQTPLGLQYEILLENLEVGTSDIVTVDLVASDAAMTTASVSLTVPEVSTNDGDDIIFAGNGSDFLEGNNGDDQLFGEAGDDVIFGNSGNDIIADGAGNDITFGNAGDDTFLAGVGANSYDGGSGVDTLDFSAFISAINVDLRTQTTFSGGAAGNDTITGIESLIGTAGNDRLVGNAEGDADTSSGNNLLDGGAGNDRIFGGGGDDTILDGAGNDDLFGNSGNDLFIAGAGANNYDGGSGSDTVDFSAFSGAINVDLRTQDTLSGGAASNDTITSIENLVGTAGNDRLVGSNGSTGANILDGGAGDDRIFGGGGNDTILDGDGDDELFGNSGNDIFIAGSGANEYDGGSGVDTVDFSDFTGAINIDLRTQDTLSGGAAGNDTITGIENIIGTSGNDRLVGNASGDADTATGNNLLDGGAGNDIIFGGGGNDTILDGAGNDELFGNSGNDRFTVGSGANDYDGGSGIDLLDYSGFSGAITVNLSSNTTSGGAAGNDTIVNIENIIGTTGSDTLVGSSGDNALSGREGNDRLFGGNGSDRLFGGDGEDFFDGGGGSGTDELFGGAGADIFHFDSGEGTDIVSDFQNNIDTIQFDNFAGTTTTAAFISDFATQAGNDVVFDFGSDGNLTVLDTTLGRLQNDVEIV